MTRRLVMSPADLASLCHDIPPLAAGSLLHCWDIPIHVNPYLPRIPKTCELPRSPYWSDAYRNRWNAWAIRTFGAVTPVYVVDDSITFPLVKELQT